MNNKKATKRALLTSVMALAMCVVMLVGTTFAWFTDTAKTSVNQIKAGKLDVALEMKNPEYDPNVEGSKEWINAENKTLDFKKAAEGADQEILWEPGCTYELPELRVINNGNLALKYKVTITGIKGDAKLNEVIDWEITGTDVDNDGYAHLGANESKEITIKGVMQTTAGNEYQGLTIDGAAITVFATQDTVEYDSIDNQYDKDAPIVYPEGVTEVNFDEADATYTKPGSTEKQNDKPAIAAYEDADGNVKYVADVKEAVANGATTVYLKENTAGRLMAVSDYLAQPNRTDMISHDLTIYANGADFQYGELHLDPSANITVRVYDAKNIKIWGDTPNDGVTQNIEMVNCHNEGESATGSNGEMIMLWGDSGTVNATITNCSVAKADLGIYFGCDGSLTVKDSSFTECATGIKISYKGTGTRTDRIENCTFTKCGCTAEMAGTGSTAYLANDSAAIKYKTNSGSGNVTLTLKGNTITGTIGDKGDTQIASSINIVNE